MLQYFRKYYYIWKLAEIPHTRWSGPACSSPWTTHAATESWQTTTHHPEPHEQKQCKGWGIHMPMERLSFLPLLNPPRLPMAPPEGEEIQEILWITTQQRFSIYCQVSNAFLKASPPLQQTFPFPKHYPRHQWFLQCFQLMCLVHFQLHPSSAALSWSPTAMLTIFDASFDSLEGFSQQAGCTGRTAPSWNEPQSKAEFTGTKLWVQNPEGQAETAPTPAGTHSKVTCRATSIWGFLLANGSWVPGCCCIVCSRHTNSSGYWEPTLQRHGKTTS